MKKITKILLGTFVLLMFFNISACKKDKNKSQSEDLQTTVTDSLTKDETFETAKEIFYSLPAPNEVSMILLEDDDIYYDESILNPLSNAEKYSTNFAKAMNLGIYSADLSYASIYEQNQTVVNYMATAKKLAESLGILEVFDDQTIDRLEKNFNNRDSILNIISQTYMESDAYLKENKREELASLIMIGGWIEGLYLATYIAKEQDFKNQNLNSKLIEQELSVQLIMDFLNSYNNKTMLKEVEPDIKKIAQAYKVLSENSTINQNGDYIASVKDLENLYVIVSEIRNKYVNMF